MSQWRMISAKLIKKPTEMSENFYSTTIVTVYIVYTIPRWGKILLSSILFKLSKIAHYLSSFQSFGRYHGKVHS